jgi:hypothetical protein
MKWKTPDILRIMVLILVMIFFGTGVMLTALKTAGDAARWAFDILSALLFLFIFFWLMAQEQSIKQRS